MKTFKAFKDKQDVDHRADRVHKQLQAHQAINKILAAAGVQSKEGNFGGHSMLAGKVNEFNAAHTAYTHGLIDEEVYDHIKAVTNHEGNHVKHGWHFNELKPGHK